MNRRIAGLLATAALMLAGVLAVTSGASGAPFTNFRQAAGAQYGGNPAGNPPSTGGSPSNGGSGTAPASETGNNSGGGVNHGNAGGGGGGGGHNGGGSNANAATATPTANLVFLSPIDPVIIRSVTRVLAQMGQPAPAVVSLREPVRLPAVAGAASGTRYARVTAKRLSLVEALGRKVGREFIKPSAFLRSVGPVLFPRTRTSAGLTDFKPRKFIIFARTGGKLDALATKVRNALESGMAGGVHKTKVPAAGVETTKTKPSQIKWFKHRKISSVDNVETRNGQRALLAILQGKAKGAFGVKKTADRLLPKSVRTSAHVNLDTGSSVGAGTGFILLLFGIIGAWATLSVYTRVRRSSAR